MRRHAAGILAFLLLATAGYGFARYGLNADDSGFFWSSCWRIGLVLGAVWLAFPQLMRLTEHVSPAVLAVVGTIAAVVVVRPRTIVVLGPILLLLAILQFFGWLIKPPPKKNRRKQSVSP